MKPDRGDPKPPGEVPSALVRVFPDGRFALVPDLGMDAIVVYHVDAKVPSITRHGIIPANPGSGPRHMRFSIDGRFIYLLNEMSLSVTTYAWDPVAGTGKMLSTVATLSEEAKGKEASNSAAEILSTPQW